MKHGNLILGYFLLCAAGATACIAAPVDGKWTAQVQGRNGATTQTLTLKSSGTALTGSLDAGRGGANDIAEGKISGSDVMFKVTRQGRNGNRTTDYSGKISGDELKLTATREGGGGKGGPQELDFKRAQ